MNDLYIIILSVEKQPIPPNGISFINLAKLSPSFSSLKQDIVTTKESPIQIGTHEDQSAFHKTQNKVDIPKKLSTVTPKGINFLSFGKGSICSFKNGVVFDTVTSLLVNLTLNLWAFLLVEKSL